MNRRDVIGGVLGATTLSALSLLAVPALAISKSAPILIADDFHTMRGIVKSSLKALGFTNFAEATDGTEALSKVRSSDRNRYGLIICDYTLPTMDGMAVLNALRNDPSAKTIPFLMMFGDAHSRRKDLIAAVLAAGPSDYIIKPFNNETLKNKIKKATNSEFAD